jgi:hypothetical protein
MKLVDISGTERKEYLNATIDELQTSSKIKIISCGILARWRGHFSQLLNVHGFNDIRQTGIHIAELLVPEPCAVECEMAVEKLKIHKSPGIDQIPAELIKAGGKTIRYEIHKLIISIWNYEEMPEEWKELIIYLCVRRVVKQFVKIVTEAYHFLSTTYKILSNILLSRLTPYEEEIIGDHKCEF